MGAGRGGAGRGGRVGAGRAGQGGSGESLHPSKSFGTNVLLNDQNFTNRNPVDISSLIFLVDDR